MIVLFNNILSTSASTLMSTNIPNDRVPEEPENMEEIRRVLAQPRRSLSPSRFTDEDFRKFKRAAAHASKERQVTTAVLPIIEGDVGDSKCVAGENTFHKPRSFDRRFTGTG